MSSSSYETVKQARWMLRRRLVIGFGGECAICHLRDDDVVYDFHHIDPAIKEFEITNKIRSWKNVVAEIVKCVMICCHCHRKLHRGLVVIPPDYHKFDATIIPEFVTLPGEGVDLCPACGKPKRSKAKACSIVCAGRLRKGKPRTWSVGSRKGTKMPRFWSRRPRKENLDERLS